MTLKTTALAGLATLALTTATPVLAQDTINATNDPTITTTDDDRDHDGDSGKWGLLGLLGLAGLLGRKRRDDHRDHVHTDRDRTTTPR
jgi:MYXO-CTERM domain-containing protein